MIVCDITEPQGPFPTAPIEEHTGADIIVSPLQMPITPVTLAHHISAGALLIQRKSGLDLISSIGARLYSSLARMRATGARQWQCVLLTTGVFIPDLRDNTCIVAIPTVHPDGHVEWRYLSHPEPRPYQAIVSSLRHWTWYGGTVVQLPSDDGLLDWLRVTEARLIEKRNAVDGTEVREVWPDAEPFPDDGGPLQQLREVRDWRRILATFPGIGPARATALRNAMLEASAVDTLLQALVWATEDYKVAGWGPGVRKRVREALGLAHNESLTVEHEFPGGIQ